MKKPKDVSIHERLAAAADDLKALLERLEQEVVHKQRKGFAAGGSPSKGGHRPLAACNIPALMLVLDVHQAVRQIEADLQRANAGHARRRGGSDNVTGRLLDTIPGLAAGQEQTVGMRVMRQLESYCWRARLVLGEKEPWAHLPRLPGQPPPRCPWCNFTTLRYRAWSGVVRCLNPACADADGNKPVGRLELGRASGEPQLAWHDGTSGI